MTETDELNAIYKAILAAARQQGLARYSDLIALQDLAHGQRPELTLKIRLHKLLKICKRRDWPAISVVVVGEHDVLLSQKGLSSFVEGARNAGYAVQDPREFETEQKEALYRWVPSAPDSLDLSDHEMQKLSQTIRGAGGGNAVRKQGERARMEKSPRSAGRVLLYLKGLLKTFLVPIATAVIAGLILMNWQNIWLFFKQL